MHYALTPQIWPSFSTVVLLLALIIYSGYRRRVAGALPFMIGCLFAALWAAGSVMEYAALDLPEKILWFKFQGVWRLAVATAVTCFVLEYAWPGRWLTRRNLVLLSIPCLLGLGLILTNDSHHLIWSGFEFDGKVIPLYNPFYWILMAYGYGLVILSLIILVWLFLRSPESRWPVVMMVTGQVVGRGIYLLEVARISQKTLLGGVPPIAFEYLMYAVALFGFQILNPIPLARRMAIQQLHSGMLVLDPQGRIVSLNPAAVQILGLPEKHILGRPVQELLSASSGMEGDLQATESDWGEINLGFGVESRSYKVDASTLNDWRGLEVGRLLVLRDVTGQKQAEAQLLEQQRALAMLHEREQLARELHDSLGQVLGYAGLKMGAARKLIADGKLAKADDQLAHLESSLTEAHADVREYILNLRTAPGGEKPFFSALQHYLDGFHQNYGIRVEVSISPGVSEDVFTPEAQVQLFRILQEALSNARKHAATNQVNVSFETEDGRLRMRIQDNGKGFDPLELAGAGGSHFGLSIMRERAEQLGGELQVQSAAGEGTCVEVEMPVVRERRGGRGTR